MRRRSRTRARFGLMLVAGAGLISVSFGGRHALSLEGLGRVVVIALLFAFAYLGRSWASAFLAALAVAAVVGLILGAAAAGFGSLWGVLFLSNALIYALGLVLFFVAGGAAAMHHEIGRV